MTPEQKAAEERVRKCREVGPWVAYDGDLNRMGLLAKDNNLLGLLCLELLDKIRELHDCPDDKPIRHLRIEHELYLLAGIERTEP